MTLFVCHIIIIININNCFRVVHYIHFLCFSTALDALKKLKFIPLRFKNENKEVTAWICQDGADYVNIPQNPLQEESKTPSPEVSSLFCVWQKT